MPGCVSVLPRAKVMEVSVVQNRRKCLLCSKPSGNWELVRETEEDQQERKVAKWG